MSTLHETKNPIKNPVPSDGTAAAEAVQHPTNKPYVTDVTNTLRKIDSGPSHAHHDPKKIKQVPVDIVEEESMESFPASDPPGHSHPRKDAPDPRRPGPED